MTVRMNLAALIFSLRNWFAEKVWSLKLLSTSLTPHFKSVYMPAAVAERPALRTVGLVPGGQCLLPGFLQTPLVGLRVDHGLLLKDADGIPTVHVRNTDQGLALVDKLLTFFGQLDGL